MATNVFDGGNKDNWCRYVLHQIADCPWDKFDPSWLSVVTFNYDRSLEFFLGQALQHRYGKGQEEVLERLAALKIVHVYGSLGSPWKGAEDYLPYKTRDADDQAFAEEYWIRKAADRIRVIPEGRDDDASLKAAKELLGQASRVCVLGFGFDETNIRRIGAPDTFKDKQAASATAIGLTDAEKARACRHMFGDSGVGRFMGLRCLGLLRETHILFS